MGGFNPYAPLPPELETGPITTPIGPLGAGAPMQPDAQAQAAQAALARLTSNVSGLGLAGPGTAMNPGADVGAHTGAGLPAFPASTGLAGPALPPPGIRDVSLAHTLPSIPGMAPAGAPFQAPPAPAPAPARRAGGGPGGGVTKPDDLEKQIVANGQAGAAGIEKVQGAKAEGADALAKSQEGLSDLQGEQADQRAAFAQQTREKQALLDEQDAANLKKAKDYTIPDFWKGSEGAKVGSIISIAMGGIASGILGGANGALQIVNKNVDDYFYRQKEKVDNLYKYAEQTGRLNNQTRLRYAQDLSDLQAQHTAVQASVLTRIEAVKARNQGHIDEASTDKLVTDLKGQVLEAQEKHRTTAAHVANETLTARANANAANANAAESRANAKLKLAQAANPAGLHGQPSGEMLKSQGFADTAASNDQIIAQTPITPQGMQTILTDMQREGMFKEGGTARSVAQSLGAWKTIEQKLGPQDQRALLAARQFINADLRRESGAAISPTEFQSAFARYFPAVGDSPDTISQKALNRQQSIHSMRIAGGQVAGGNPVAGPAPIQAQPQQAQQYPVGTRATSGGKPIVMTANGWQLAQ